MSEKQKPRRPLTKPRWSKEEDDIIRQYYATEGSAVYKRMSGRTKAACILRAKNIGIVCNKEVRYQRENTWTEEELAILQEYYPIEGRNVSERLPNRTASQCSAKANSMKIHLLGAKKSHYRWTHVLHASHIARIAHAELVRNYLDWLNCGLFLGQQKKIEF